jgi:hypothetical protein
MRVEEKTVIFFLNYFVLFIHTLFFSIFFVFYVVCWVFSFSLLIKSKIFSLLFVFNQVYLNFRTFLIYLKNPFKMSRSINE